MHTQCMLILTMYSYLNNICIYPTSLPVVFIYNPVIMQKYCNTLATICSLEILSTMCVCVYCACVHVCVVRVCMCVCVVYASEAINSYSHEMNLQSNTSATTPVSLAVMVGVAP